MTTPRLLTTTPLDIRAMRDGTEQQAPPLAGTDELPPLQRSLQLYLPEVAPIPGAYEFHRNDVVASPGAGTLTPAGLVYTIPRGSRGIIRTFTAAITDLTNASRFFFGIRIDQRPDEAWGNWLIPPGLAARATMAAGTWIRIPEGGRIDVTLTNVDGAAYSAVSADFSGWYWPLSAEAAWLGELYESLKGGIV